MLTRRRFLAGAALTPLALSEAWAGAERPDIVFVLADDLRADALGFTGSPLARTPHIDRLAREGVAFDEHFVTLSLCAPSRAATLTGLYPHATGVVDNRFRALPAHLATFPALLRDAGYRTAYVGKWHMDDSAAPRPGFDRWVSFRGQATYTNPTLNVDGVERVVPGYTTDLLTAEAVRFLREPSAQPRLLYLAHKATHAPFEPAQRHAGLLSQEPVPPPPPLGGRGRPDWIKDRARRSAKSPAAHARFMRRYFETLMSVDDSVGAVLDALGERLDHAVVVFSADNGYQHGEHGLYEKITMYEPSIRVPLVMRYPPLAKAGERVRALTLNIDLAPTFVALGGAAQAPMQGQSLVPLLDGRAETLRDSFVYEQFSESHGSMPDILGLRTTRYTLTTYPGSEEREELYDLQKDPEQHQNLARSPRHADLSQTLHAELARQAEAIGWSQDTPPPPDRAATRSGTFVLDYDFAQDQGDVVIDASGHGHEGVALGTALRDEGGRRLRRFNGRSAILAPRALGLDPSRGPWTVEALVNGEEGVILGRGVRAEGFALALVDGAAVFVARVKGGVARLVGPAVAGRWAHLVGVLAEGPVARLYVDGALVAEKPLPRFLVRDPEGPLYIGQELERGVLPELSGLRGALGRLRVYSGAREAAQIAEDAAELLALAPRLEVGP